VPGSKEAKLAVSTDEGLYSNDKGTLTAQKKRPEMLPSGIAEGSFP